MNTENLYKKALNLEFLTFEEGMSLYKNAPLSHLMFISNEIRKKNQTPGNRNKVGLIIDRNVNIANGCIAQCKFCNFYRHPNDPEAYITTMEQYREKIKELYDLGGRQLLLQGGLHPKLNLEWYKKLFSDLKAEFPDLLLHALGPAEIHHIAKISRSNYKEVLEELTKAGLDSLPGAGAEILVDRVRKEVSKGKCSSKEWLDVMREAHRQKITTSATMMFGHIETKEERLLHLLKLREVQAEAPEGSDGFTAFIPWPFQDENTELNTTSGIKNNVSGAEYIRIVAMARIMMPNIKNLQASWLTVGKDIGQMCLHAGANDFGSVMIEENVVSAAGAKHSFTEAGIVQAIKEGGFQPVLRNQKYEYQEQTQKTTANDIL
ncbi:MAG: cyclic dehypoxanthinyl futalosine synthase [Bacteroidota bacterium]|nr:cyclic dehypoxanthinyl futalosine synthase [Bacteroidota bacterium]